MMKALAALEAEQSQSEFHDEFLTQKELDPDSIAFNSQNSRYHFPARFYLPSRSVFGQVDLVARKGITNELYQYGKHHPTGSVDPLGLQDIESSGCKRCGADVT